MNKQELIDFENDIEAIYKTGAIKGPIHLRDGNEDILIDIFKDIKPYDYVFATWSNHLEALLKGIPKEKVKARILEGNSMAMNFPEHRFYTSAIVGGTCSIATGVALAIKKIKAEGYYTYDIPHVYVFIGDMSFHTGVAHESIKYAIYNDLPITFIVADNNKSVDTPTDYSWTGHRNVINTTCHLVKFYENLSYEYNGRFIIKYYRFNSRFAHSGVGSFVSF